MVKKKDPYPLFEENKIEMEYVKKLYDKDERVYIIFDGEKVDVLQSGKGGIFEPPQGKIDIWDEVRKCKAELEEIKEIIDALQGNEAVEQ